ARHQYRPPARQGGRALVSDRRSGPHHAAGAPAQALRKAGVQPRRKPRADLHHPAPARPELPRRHRPAPARRWLFYAARGRPAGALSLRRGHGAGHYALGLQARHAAGLCGGGRGRVFVLSGGGAAGLRALFGGAVCAGLGHHAAASGGQSLRGYFRAARVGLVAAVAHAGLQLAGHYAGPAAG
nr:hypothetical protein [Tanacetum cinerariifolium]